MIEQSPATWPRLHSLDRTAAQAQHLHALGYPTECDGDSLAIHRGDIHRIATLTD